MSRQKQEGEIFALKKLKSFRCFYHFFLNEVENLRGSAELERDRQKLEELERQKLKQQQEKKSQRARPWDRNHIFLQQRQRLFQQVERERQKKDWKQMIQEREQQQQERLNLGTSKDLGERNVR